jgi:hypothetical protein
MQKALSEFRAFFISVPGLFRGRSRCNVGADLPGL